MRRGNKNYKVTTVSSEDSNSSVGGLVDSAKVRTTTVRGKELVGYYSC